MGQAQSVIVFHRHNPAAQCIGLDRRGSPRPARALHPDLTEGDREFWWHRAGVGPSGEDGIVELIGVGRDRRERDRRDRGLVQERDADQHDQHRARKANAPASSAELRRIALGIIKANTAKGSNRVTFKKAGWSNDFLRTLIEGF